MGKKTKEVQRWNAEGGYLEKRCGRCGTWYPATPEYFIRNKNNPDGLAYRCKPCNREVQRQWREENPEYWVAYREKNAERIATLAAAYRERNRVELRRRNREYIARTRAARLEAQRRYYEDNREMIRARVKADYDENRAARLAQKRRWYAQAGDITPEERAAAGTWYKADVVLGDGGRGRVLGKRSGLWLVWLYEPIKTGPKQFQHVVQVRQVWAYESTIGLYPYEYGEGA